MASSYKALTAQQVRIDYRKKFSRVDLLPPHIVDALPGDADGLMPIAKIGASINVDISEWPDRIPDFPGDPTDTLYLAWLPASSSEYLDIGAPEEIPGSNTLPSDQFPLRRQIPLSIFENYEGLFQFRYMVKMWNGSEVFASAPVTIDRTGPIRPGTPQAMLVADLITTDSLDADNGVICEVPDFVEVKKEFVKIAVGWMATIPESEADFPTLVAFFDLLPSTRKILVPKKFITDIGSKTHYVVYFLFDKAGNRSEMSLPKGVSVALGELPADLKPCSVPLAADGRIDRADAAAATGPTKVHLEEYTGWHRDDGIVVKWKDQEVRTTVAAQLPFPLAIIMTWSVLQQTYDFTTGGDQTVAVDYAVLRGDYPTPSPGPISVIQNFEMPGPVNPLPEPINDKLELIRFNSSQDSSTELNVGDINEDAEGFIKLFDDPKTGDVLTLIYNGIEAGIYTVLGTESPNQEISIRILWDVIKQFLVMADLPMYYTVTRAGVPNPQESKRTTINVVLERVDLPEPTLPGSPINCTHLVEKAGKWGINVHIPTSNHLKAGAHVVAVWNSYLIDGTTEIPKTYLVEEIPVGPEEERNGVDWFIPYEKCLKPTYGGSGSSGGRGRVAYSIDVRGDQVASDVVTTLIGVFEDGGHCAIPRP